MKNCFLFVLLFSSFTALAQKKETTGNPSFDSIIERYKKERVGTSFPPMGEWKTTDGRTFNFNTFPKPTVVYVGSGTCPPCGAEMPYLMQYAGKHPEANFVYLIASDSAAVLQQHPEFKDGSLPSNFFALSIPDSYVRGYHVKLAYPTKWMLAAMRGTATGFWQIWMRS